MSDEPDPWSTDVPVPPAPPEFVFGDSGAFAESKVPVRGQGPPKVPSPVEVDPTARRRWIGAGTALSVVLVGILVAAAVRSGDNTEASVDSTITPASNAADELPVATTPPSTTVRTTTSSGPTSTNDEEPIPLRTWIDGQFVIPDRLAEFETPTQLVALTNRGLVIEIDLATGATSTLDLNERSQGSQLHVRERVSLIISDDGSGTGARPVLVERSRPPIEVEVPRS